jgi:endo-1,4-beta-xylanase
MTTCATNAVAFASPVVALAAAMAMAVEPAGESAAPHEAVPSLAEAAARRGLLFGAAVTRKPLEQEPRYRAMMARQCGIITPENEMKWKWTQPEPGHFTWDHADPIIAFAREHGLQIRNHTALWHQALPEWVTRQAQEDAAQLADITRDHIQAVAERYGPDMLYWDVVNEAFEDDGTFRRNVWREHLGRDYLAMAYAWAHEAAPHVKLVYNDYGAETLNAKSDAIYNELRRLLRRGVPIHAVGFQMHLFHGPPDLESMKTNFRRFADLGLEIHITEMDVAIQHFEGPLEQRLRRQAHIYHRVIEACLRIDAVTVIQTWGMTDAHTWVEGFTGQPDAPLLFDRQYQPKPAFWRVLESLQDSPMPDAAQDEAENELPTDSSHEQ